MSVSLETLHVNSSKMNSNIDICSVAFSLYPQWANVRPLECQPNVLPIDLRGQVGYSGEASPTFGHANANFSVFTDRIRNQFLKK